MKTVSLVEGLDYPEDEQNSLPSHYAIMCELVSRIQELDSHPIASKKNIAIPFGARAVLRLGALYRRSPRAYRLLLDLLSEQKSLSMSLADLASKKHCKNSSDTLVPHSRQSWLQNAQQDASIIKEVWFEVGIIVEEILRRRPAESDHR